MKTKYVIQLESCDASTYVVAEYTNDEAAVVKALAEQTRANSYYDCMPKIASVTPWDELDERTRNYITEDLNDS